MLAVCLHRWHTGRVSKGGTVTKGTTVKDRQARDEILELQRQINELRETLNEVVTISHERTVAVKPTAIRQPRKHTAQTRKSSANRRRTKWTADETALALMLKEQGATYAQIAAVMNRTKNGVRDHVAFVEGRKGH